MSLPLSGIRVLEICEGLAGPFGAMLLADQGAEVIKVEAPGRGFSPGAVPNLGFVSYNRNKRSITVDLTAPKGRELAYSLVRWADVVVISMRLGPRQRRGFTYENLAAINPRLIYTSLTAYGEAGPEADRPGWDVIIQARGGDIAARRPPDGPPAHKNLWHFDMATSMLIAYSTTLALYDRERTGRGQKVEVNLLQAALASQAGQMTRALGRADTPPPRARNLWDTYRCGDGRFIAAVFTTQVEWGSLCRGLERDDLATDPAYATATQRTEKAQEIYDMLSDIFLTKPAVEWEAILKANNVATSLIKEMSEVYDDPQVIANQMIIQFEQPGIGPVEAINAPVTLSGSANEPRVRRPAPGRGEHTLEVLGELGYNSQEIDMLKAEGIVG